MSDEWPDDWPRAAIQKIEELDDENVRLRGLLEFCISNLECGLVHHEKHEYHKGGVCPVMARLQDSITASPTPVVKE